MPSKYTGAQVINGTWGEVYIDGTKVAECYGLQAEVELEFSDIPMCGTLAKHKKLTGYEGKGTLKLHKVTSKFSKMVSDNLKKGKTTVVSVISKLADPNAIGAERIWIKDAEFEKATLADWEARKNTEESIPFHFTDWDFLDYING